MRDRMHLANQGIEFADVFSAAFFGLHLAFMEHDQELTEFVKFLAGELGFALSGYSRGDFRQFGFEARGVCP